jgi:hypothetical protein
MPGVFVRVREAGTDCRLECGLQSLGLLLPPAVVTLALIGLLVYFWRYPASVGAEWYAIGGVAFISLCVWAPVLWTFAHAGHPPLAVWDRRSDVVRLTRSNISFPRESVVRLELVELLYVIRGRERLDRHAVVCWVATNGAAEWTCIDDRDHWRSAVALNKFARELGADFTRPDRIEPTERSQADPERSSDIEPFDDRA